MLHKFSGKWGRLLKVERENDAWFEDTTLKAVVGLLQIKKINSIICYTKNFLSTSCGSRDTLSSYGHLL